MYSVYDSTNADNVNSSGSSSNNNTNNTNGVVPRFFQPDKVRNEISARIKKDKLTFPHG